MEERSQTAGHFSMTPSVADTGAISGLPCPLEDGYSRALAWVQHSGGSVGLSLNGAPMEKVGNAVVTALQGETWSENPFRLDGVGSGPLTVTLEMDRGSDDAVAVYNYRVVLL